jgi:hypothetical protein
MIMDTSGSPAMLGAMGATLAASAGAARGADAAQTRVTPLATDTVRARHAEAAKMVRQRRKLTEL